MKIFTVALILIFPGIVVVAQNVATGPIKVAVPTTVKVATELSFSSEKVVKGSPFSAEGVNESVQTLADGNRIVRSWSEKLYRSSDGKFRREYSSGTGASALGSYIQGDSSITILDPVGGFRYVFNPETKTGRSMTYRAAPFIIGGGEGKTWVYSQNGVVVGDKPSTAAAEKALVELNAAKAAGQREGVIELQARGAELQAVTAAKMATLAAPAMPAVPGEPVPLAQLATKSPKYESHTEQLGTQNFEGVDAEGTRTTTTIPAGAIGNERPIEIVYERWYSKELQMIVYSKHSDPRFGEQTYRLTNINRSEPDPSLFEVPPGYKVTSQTRPTSYRVVSPRGTAGSAKNINTSTVTKP